MDVSRVQHVRPLPQMQASKIDQVTDETLDRLIVELGLKQNHTLPDPCCFVCRENIRYTVNLLNRRATNFSPVKAVR